MIINKFPACDDLQLQALRQSLTFLYVDELKEVATRLTLSDAGKKMELILRILHFLKTGEKLITPKFPAVSCAKRGHNYPISSNALMLKGAYKNDLQTRLFFKHLIGDHFHFTAFGIDWLNERWMEGNPPTYQEFATMWQSETNRRKIDPAAPKEEWAYINFIQQMMALRPDASQQALHHAWDLERQKNKSFINTFLDQLTK